jgi:hypothetical protein
VSSLPLLLSLGAAPGLEPGQDRRCKVVSSSGGGFLPASTAGFLVMYLHRWAAPKGLPECRPVWYLR